MARTIRHGNARDGRKWTESTGEGRRRTESLSNNRGYRGKVILHRHGAEVRRGWSDEWTDADAHSNGRVRRLADKVAIAEGLDAHLNAEFDDDAQAEVQVELNTWHDEVEATDEWGYTPYLRPHHRRPVLAGRRHGYYNVVSRDF